MNQQPKYEKTIAGKLQSLPVPDMADAIWSRIEAQLDIDLPTNDGGGNPPSSSPSGPGIIGWGLSIVVIALITIFLLSKSNSESSEQTPVPANETIQQPIETTDDPPPGNTTIQRPVNPVTDPVVDNTANPQQDSTVQQSITQASGEVQDSASINKAPTIVSSNPPVANDSIPSTGKKRRGVSGINDNDYRIEPKKDN